MCIYVSYLPDGSWLLSILFATSVFWLRHASVDLFFPVHVLQQAIAPSAFCIGLPTFIYLLKKISEVHFFIRRKFLDVPFFF